MALRVLIADDHAIVREGIQRILENNDIDVVGHAFDINSVLSSYKNLNPDVVLLDISMPGCVGVEGVINLIKQDGDVKIVVFSIHESPQFVERVLNAGALAYVTKSSDLTELVIAIKSVFVGKPYIATDLAQSLVFFRMKGSMNPVDILTERELNIFCLLAEGKEISEIAGEIFLAEKTVANYVSQIKQKLKLKSSIELVRLAIQFNLIQLDGVVSINTL